LKNNRNRIAVREPGILSFRTPADAAVALHISLSGLVMVLAGLALVMLGFAIYAWRHHRRAASA
jgi:hypothetical protein